LLDVAVPFLASDTLCLFPKGERFNEELTLARKAWKMDASVEQSLSDRRGVVLRLQQVAREPRQA
jgi:16S rRNA (guanine527-N7)-methyltransferase